MPDPLQHQNETDFVRTSIGAAAPSHEVRHSDGSYLIPQTGIQISDNSAIMSFRQPVLSCMAAVIIFVLPAFLGFYYIYQVGVKLPALSEHGQTAQSISQPSEFSFKDFVGLKGYLQAPDRFRHNISPLSVTPTREANSESWQTRDINDDVSQTDGMNERDKKQISRTDEIRYAFALANSEILIIAMSVLFIAFVIPLLLHLVGLRPFLVLLAVAVVHGVYVNYQFMQPLISSASIASSFTMDALKQSIKANTMTVAVAQDYFIHIQYTGFLIWTATSLLIVTLAATCLRQFNERWPQGLRLRRNILIMTAAFSGLFYAIGIYRLKITLEWPSQFIHDERVRALAQESAAEYVHGAGMLFTIQVVLMFAIATAVLRNDMAIAGKGEYRSLISSEDLKDLARFIPTTLIFFSPIIAGLPPAFVTTIMDFLNLL